MGPIYGYKGVPKMVLKMASKIVPKMVPTNRKKWSLRTKKMMKSSKKMLEQYLGPKSGIL